MASYYVEKLHTDGVIILKNIFSADLADKVVNDFQEWSSVKENNFTPGQRERVTNFHTFSTNTKDLVTNECVKEVLDTFFKKESVIYSSLFFREGTSQHFHRDTPHFYTNPMDLYCGVWYALEDIDQTAGPLKYYPKSHQLSVPNGIETYNRLLSNNTDNFKDKEYSKQNFDCLMEYNKILEDECERTGLQACDETNYLNNKIEKGDVIIWHPKLVHGGSMVIDTSLTRYSMVTHNIPINTQVFNAEHFFRKTPSRDYIFNDCEYTYNQHNNVNYVKFDAGPKVQLKYI